MPQPDAQRISLLLEEIGRGDRAAADRLFPEVYQELRRLAGAQMAAERPGHTLQATALVHEAYLRLLGSESVQWSNRRHFFGAAAEAMRRILIDRARRARRLKRGGELQRVELTDDAAVLAADADRLLAVHVALEKLEGHDPRMAEVVKLRYFAGLTVPEIARAFGASTRTVDRLWTAAKAWLHRELGATGRSGAPS